MWIDSRALVQCTCTHSPSGRTWSLVLHLPRLPYLMGGRSRHKQNTRPWLPHHNHNMHPNHAAVIMTMHSRSSSSRPSWSSRRRSASSSSRRAAAAESSSSSAAPSLPVLGASSDDQGGCERGRASVGESTVGVPCCASSMARRACSFRRANCSRSYSKALRKPSGGSGPSGPRPSCSSGSCPLPPFHTRRAHGIAWS